MDDRTGQLYASRAEAQRAGVPEEHIVELLGSLKAIDRVSSAVRHASKHARAKKRKAGRRKEAPDDVRAATVRAKEGR